MNAGRNDTVKCSIANRNAVSCGMVKSTYKTAMPALATVLQQVVPPIPSQNDSIKVGVRITVACVVARAEEVLAVCRETLESKKDRGEGEGCAVR